MIVLPSPDIAGPSDRRCQPHDRSDRPPASGPRVHRRRGPPARLPAERPRDRRGRRPVVDLHRARAPRRAAGQGLPPPRPDQAARDRGRASSPSSGAVVERRPVRHVPLVGDVAAGTGVLAAENIEETLPLPEDFTGDGDALHAPRARRVDDRRRHPRRRLRRRPSAAVRRQRATSSSPASPARRPRSRPSCGGAARSCCGPRTRRWTRWSSTRPTSPSTARSCHVLRRL